MLFMVFVGGVRVVQSERAEHRDHRDDRRQDQVGSAFTVVVGGDQGRAPGPERKDRHHERGDEGADECRSDTGPDFLGGVVQGGTQRMRLLGMASTRPTAQIVMTVRNPIVMITMPTTITVYPWSTAQASQANPAVTATAPVRQATRRPNRATRRSVNGLYASMVTMIGKGLDLLLAGLRQQADQNDADGELVSVTESRVDPPDGGAT
jgi:hypothetical protein